ncbi:MAG: arginine repressor [Clostridia bacterium]|nr:arginine repressor [Clostridia bacterium]
MKNARQQKILELIEKYDIDTQETLINRLKENGYNVTQTTISRDIRQLNLVKGVSSKGEYKYVAPGARRTDSIPVLSSAITDSVIKIAAAGNIVVVRTFSGMANALAVCVDSLHHDDIVGSVAGDDTILLVVNDNESATNLASELRAAFGKNKA